MASRQPQPLLADEAPSGTSPLLLRYATTRVEVQTRWAIRNPTEAQQINEPDTAEVSGALRFVSDRTVTKFNHSLLRESNLQQ